MAGSKGGLPCIRPGDLKASLVSSDQNPEKSASPYGATQQSYSEPTQCTLATTLLPLTSSTTFPHALCQTQQGSGEEQKPCQSSVSTHSAVQGHC